MIKVSVQSNVHLKFFGAKIEITENSNRNENGEIISENFNTLFLALSLLCSKKYFSLRTCNPYVAEIPFFVVCLIRSKNRFTNKIIHNKSFPLCMRLREAGSIAGNSDADRNVKQRKIEREMHARVT